MGDGNDPFVTALVVYGTLRPDLYPYADLTDLGRVTVANYRLWALGGFPAAVPGPVAAPRTIVGRLVSVSLSSLALLDRIEGFEITNLRDSLYWRVPVLADGEYGVGTAEMYIWNPYRALPPDAWEIESGDWATVHAILRGQGGEDDAGSGAEVGKP